MVVVPRSFKHGTGPKTDINTQWKESPCPKILVRSDGVIHVHRNKAVLASVAGRG